MLFLQWGSKDWTSGFQTPFLFGIGMVAGQIFVLSGIEMVWQLARVYALPCTLTKITKLVGT